MKILIAIESFYDGGAEIFAIRLANELAEFSQVYFLELDYYKTKEKRQAQLLNTKKIKLIQAGKNIVGDWLFGEDVNVSSYFVKARNYLKPAYYFLKKIQVKNIIKKYGISTVNSHSWDTDVYFASLKNNINFRLVSSFHGHYEFLANKRINFDEQTKEALNVIDKVIYTSPEHQKTLKKIGLPESKSVKIFYGVSMPLALKVTNYQHGNVLKLVMVARGIKEKGWEEAVLAVIELLKKYRGLITLNLVGEGKYLDYMKRKYLNDAVVFCGFQNDVAEIVNEAHIGLLPSYYIAESLPNTIIEYLFAGKPVITTNIGAIKEMIFCNNEAAGQCIDLENNAVNIESLTAAIEKYIKYPELVNKHSLVALKASEKFTMKKCVDNYLEVLNAR